MHNELLSTRFLEFLFSNLRRGFFSDCTLFENYITLCFDSLFFFPLFFSNSKVFCED